ncbi:hypothetical protein BD414DRAFT_481167 [Trametes punicea]|nr:hypothetical protein BD414DRAFT_481167 [Trametes punicea]
MVLLGWIAETRSVVLVTRMVNVDCSNSSRPVFARLIPLSGLSHCPFPFSLYLHLDHLLGRHVHLHLHLHRLTLIRICTPMPIDHHRHPSIDRLPHVCRAVASSTYACYFFDDRSRLIHTAYARGSRLGIYAIPCSPWHPHDPSRQSCVCTDARDGFYLVLVAYAPLLLILQYVRTIDGRLCHRNASYNIYPP